MTNVMLCDTIKRILSIFVDKSCKKKKDYKDKISMKERYLPLPAEWRQ